MNNLINILEEINLEKTEDECCIICRDIIINEFGLLNCDCKTLYFHNNCLNIWLIKCNKCPQCNKKFPNKPSKYKKTYINNPIGMFLVNYNILRIMSGFGGLIYSS